MNAEAALGIQTPVICLLHDNLLNAVSVSAAMRVALPYFNVFV